MPRRRRTECGARRAARDRDLGDRRGVLVERLQVVLFIASRPSEGDVDLPHLKAAELKVNVNVDLENVGELERQRVEVPTRLFTEPVEREPLQPELRLVKIVYNYRGNLQQSHFPRGQNKSPACDHSILGINDDRQNEAELIDTRVQLADLSGWVFAGLTAERLQRGDVSKFRIEIAGYGQSHSRLEQARISLVHVLPKGQARITSSHCNYDARRL
jgi:hypothetical protein